MLRSKRNYKINSNNWGTHTEPQTVAEQEQITYNDALSQKKQMILPNVQCSARSTLYGRNHKELQKNSTSVLTSSIPQRKTLRSKYIINKTSNKYKKDKSMISNENRNCSDNKKINKAKTSYATKVYHETILKHNLQRRTCVHNKTEVCCNLCDNILFKDKALKEHHGRAPSETNLLPQQIVSHKFDAKRSQKQCLKVEKDTKRSLKAQIQSNTTGQTTSEISIQHIIDSKSKTSSNVKITRKNIYEINNSITIEESKKDDPEQEKRQRDKVQRTVHKYKQQTDKVEKSKYYEKTFRKQSTNDLSKSTIIESAKNDIVMYKNRLETRQLTVPLIKIENLALVELSKLISSPNYVESRPKKQEVKERCYETKNITERQQTTFNQYRTTELKQNEEINVLYHTSLVKRSHTYFEENIIEGIDAEMKDAKFNTNEYKTSSDNEINGAVALVNNEHKSKTTHLLENVLEFFLKHKVNMRDKRTTRNSKSMNLEKTYKDGRRRRVAMCFKCKEVLNLMQQFSAKINFLQDEKLCIECTLCNLQINSLSSFQQHVMDIHLQCEGKSSPSRKKFMVDIVNFNEQLDLNHDRKLVFECCCCSKIFYHLTKFQKHVNAMHRRGNNIMENIKKCKAKQGIQSSDLYTTYENKQTVNEDHALDKNLVLDIKNNEQGICNQGKETDVQNNNHRNEYCINVKSMNFINSVYCTSNNKKLLLKVEVQEKQIRDINRSSMMEITEDTQRIKQNMDNLGFNVGPTATASDASKLAIISGSKQCNTFNNVPNRGRPRKKFSYSCEICFRKYKRKHMFLSHMSKHSPNFSINGYDNQNSERFFNNSLLVTNIHTNNSQLYDNKFPENEVSLEKPNQNILMLEDSDKDICSSGTGNVECIIEKDTIDMESNNDCTYALHINLIHRSEKGIKRQKSIKFDISVAKKPKIDAIRPQTVHNEIENTLPVSLLAETNFMLHENVKDVMHELKVFHCNMCEKRFTSLTILKEHMFFLHDSLFELSQLSDLPLIPYFTDCHKIENISIENTCVLEKKHNVLSEVKISGVLQEGNGVREETVCQILSQSDTNKRYRKWRCSPCKENFALLRNYLRHKYYCHNDESVVHICDNCNKVLTSVAMVNIHMCTNVTSWHCKRCTLDFSNALSLTQHNMTHHLETVGPHTCHICKLNFLTTYMLKKHKVTHSVNESYSNVNNFRDSSVLINNCLPYSLNNVDEIVLFSGKEANLLNDVTTPFMKENTENFKELSEMNGNCCEMYLSSNVTYRNENVFQCELCNTVFGTNSEMKVHLQKSHSIKMEVCQICNDLYLTDEITKHLLHFHIVSNNLYPMENDINIQIACNKIVFENEILKILGLERLLSLYEYQRFDDISQTKYFSCMTCSKEFSSIQCYKIHYFEYHDTICLLCNIEFKHNLQAFEHKIKIHMSIDLYLWVVQKLILAVLQLSEHGSTIEEVILKCTEIRIC